MYCPKCGKELLMEVEVMVHHVSFKVDPDGPNFDYAVSLKDSKHFESEADLIYCPDIYGCGYQARAHTAAIRDEETGELI